MSVTSTPIPIDQRYSEPHYAYGPNGEHYVKHKGVRTRHASALDAQAVIQTIKANKKALAI